MELQWVIPSGFSWEILSGCDLESLWVLSWATKMEMQLD